MGRRTLADTSWDDTHAYIAAVADALALAAADDDKPVGAIGRKLEPLIVTWESLDTDRRARQRGVGRSHALVRRRDMQADACIEELNIDVLGAVRQDKRSELYTRLFPDGLAAAVKPALERQLPILRELVRQVKAPETPAELRKKHLKPLESALALGQAAVTGREDAVAEAARVSARIVLLREEADRVLLGVEGVLKSIASERKLDGRWVETFFPAAETSSRKKKPAAPPTPPAPPT